MSSGVKCWDAAGDVTFDTTFASWFLLSDDNILGANETATYSFPDAVGMSAAVSETPIYDALAIGFGAGIQLLSKHSISISYASGYPSITLTPSYHYNVYLSSVNTPMQVYIYGYYP